MNGVEFYIKGLIDDYLEVGYTNVIIISKKNHRRTINDEIGTYIEKLRNGSDDEIMAAYHDVLDVLNISDIEELEKSVEQQKEIYI